jgi:sec-independent protein translocase protein TatA
MFGLPHGPEMLIIMVVALLVFGKRLPEVARSLGETVVNFRKGLADMQNDVGQHVNPLKDELNSVQRDVQRSIEQTPLQPPTPDPVPLQLPSSVAAEPIVTPTAENPIHAELPVSAPSVETHLNPETHAAGAGAHAPQQVS